MISESAKNIIREEVSERDVLFKCTNSQEKKKRGIRGFFKRVWKAIKRPFIHKTPVETIVPPLLPDTQPDDTDLVVPEERPSTPKHNILSTETSITGPPLPNQIPELPVIGLADAERVESSGVVSVQSVRRPTETAKNSPQERRRKKTKKTRQLGDIRRAQKAVNKPLSFKPSDGDVLDHYLVGRALGSGGFGDVYRGTRISDGQKVAIKRISKKKDTLRLKIPGHSEPLLVEVALLLRMSKPPISPKVVKMFEWFDKPSSIYIIMEYPRPTISLNEYMYNNNILSESTARVLMSQAVLALNDCIKHGVYHSDIHPGNFLVNPKTLHLKLIDFNCGKLMNKKGYTRYKYRGVPSYCPPEVMKNSTLHAVPANIWQLGLMLGKMVTGYLPYNIKTFKHVRLTPGLSKGCCIVIRKCLNPKPAKRPGLLEILKYKWFQL